MEVAGGSRRAWGSEKGKAVARVVDGGGAAGGGVPLLTKRVPVEARGGEVNESGGAREACRSGLAGRGETPDGGGGLHSCDEGYCSRLWRSWRGGWTVPAQVFGLQVLRFSKRQEKLLRFQKPGRRPRLHRRGADWRCTAACSRPQPLGRCDLLPQRDCGRFARPSSHRMKKGKNEGFLRPGWAARQCFGVWP